MIISSSVWENLSTTNKTTNERLFQVAYGKTCPTLGALLFTWQQNYSLGCMKSKDQHTVGKSCLFWCSVFATICPLKNPPKVHCFDDVVLNLRTHSYDFWILFTSASSCLPSFCLLLLLLLSLYFLAPDDDNFLSKALVFPCFLVFCRIDEYISLDLFSVLSTSPVVVHSFLRKRMFSFIFTAISDNIYLFPPFFMLFPMKLKMLVKRNYFKLTVQIKKINIDKNNL